MILELDKNSASIRLLQVNTQLEIDYFKQKCYAQEYSFRAKRMIGVSYERFGQIALSGLWKRILEIQKSTNMPVTINNLTNPEFGLIDLSINEETVQEFLDSNDFKFQPYWYQVKSVLNALKFKRSRTEVATAGGKSFSIFLYIRFLFQYNKIPTDKKILVITIRKMLVNQMIEDLKNYQTDDFIKCDSIFSGGKKIKDSNVVVGTYQSLSDMDKEYFDQFAAVIIDECHSGKITSIKDEIIPKLNFQICKYIWGLSGTHPQYGTIDDLTLEAYIGPILFKIEAHELQDEGTISNIKINVINLYYNNILESQDMWYEMKDEVPATQLRIERSWLQNNPKRNNVILNIINAFNGNQIILVESVSYCNELCEMVNKAGIKKSRMIHGGIKDNDREEIKIELEEDEDVVCFATWETMSTGVSINNIMAVHFPDGGKSRYRIRQSLGRGLRLHKNKKHLIVFDYVDYIKKDDNWPGPYKNRFINHGKERQKIYTDQKFPFSIINYNL